MGKLFKYILWRTFKVITKRNTKKTNHFWFYLIDIIQYSLVKLRFLRFKTETTVVEKNLILLFYSYEKKNFKLSLKTLVQQINKLKQVNFIKVKTVCDLRA